MKTYAVKDCFRTIQGEGQLAGTAAVFLRLAGCNMWSGDPSDRVRDAQRNHAECPRWCDTDFVGGMKMTSAQIKQIIEAKRKPIAPPLTVITGGEPMLQIDDELLEAIYDPTKWTPSIAIETNGSVEPKFDINQWINIVHITLSPKQPRSMLKLPLKYVGEVKLVVPAYDPKEWEDVPMFVDRYVQPQAWEQERSDVHERAAADFVIENPQWKLSLQMHKIVGVP